MSHRIHKADGERLFGKWMWPICNTPSMIQKFSASDDEVTCKRCLKKLEKSKKC